MAKLKGLGRGLDALLGGNDTRTEDAQAELAVGMLKPGRFQPRTRMDPQSIAELAERETRLKRALEEIKAQYDYVLIDCPPALNLLTVNGLCAANAVMIPMQCEYYALEGLSDLVQTIKKVRMNLNPALEIEGLLRTMYDPRNMLSQQVSDQLQQHFGDKVYRTLVPRNVRLAEAPSYGAPAVTWDKASKGAQAYVALTEEILKGYP